MTGDHTKLQNISTKPAKANTMTHTKSTLRPAQCQELPYSEDTKQSFANSGSHYNNNNNEISNLIADLYYVVVTDANTCSVSYSFNITQPGML